VVVCGGLGGVMEAVCRGARSQGGMTIGILPGSDGSEANGYVDIAIPTGMGEMRNALIVRAADAVIAISGGFGTLSEIGFALKLGKRVVGLSTWDLSRAGDVPDAVLTATSAEEAVRLALTR
jgi:uncharacterized protein (TIGR00725 family)